MKGMPFSPEMAKALREGRKSETRRVIKHPLLTTENEFDEFDGSGTIEDGSFVWHTIPKSGSRICAKPRYKPGDVCYVQEAWRIIERPRRMKIADLHGGHDGCAALVQYRHWDLPSSADSPVLVVGNDRGWKECPQSADQGYADAMPSDGKTGKWRSPRFMPAWAARTFVLIEAVRAESVQEITNIGVLCEGLDSDFNPFCETARCDCGTNGGCIEDYAKLFTRLHPKAPYRFEDDPWVWVYTLRLTETTTDGVVRVSE